MLFRSEINNPTPLKIELPRRQRTSNMRSFAILFLSAAVLLLGAANAAPHFGKRGLSAAITKTAYGVDEFMTAAATTGFRKATTSTVKQKTEKALMNGIRGGFNRLKEGGSPAAKATRKARTARDAADAAEGRALRLQGTPFAAPAQKAVKQAREAMVAADAKAAIAVNAAKEADAAAFAAKIPK